jgi:hypothetical protein
MAGLLEPQSRYAWEIAYKFAYNPNTWNKLFRRSEPGNPSGAPGWYEVVRKNDTSVGIYEKAEFGNLFELP